MILLDPGLRERVGSNKIVYVFMVFETDDDYASPQNLSFIRW